MTELFQAELLTRLAKLELRVDLLAKALADALRTSADAAKPEDAPAASFECECEGKCPCTPPWKHTSTGGAL